MISLKRFLQLAHLRIAEWFLTAPYKMSADGEESMHGVFKDFLGRVNELPKAKILEIGSRETSGVVRKGCFADSGGYVGFDFHPGKNVDVVGDAHKLSRYFEKDSFDAVFSFSVLEHIAMPWQVIIEMNRVLKPGGLLFISTHPCWPAHEQPWDFWRFQAESFKVLLNNKTGFEIEQCIEGMPAKIVPLGKDRVAKTLIQCNTHLSIVVLAKKQSSIDDPFLWDFSPEQIMHTEYPAPSE